MCWTASPSWPRTTCGPSATTTTTTPRPTRPSPSTFDGHSWTAVSTPNRSTSYNALQSVVTLAPDDVWAAGAYRTTGQTHRNLTLIEHFDGSSWSIVDSPNHRGETNAQLLGVAAPGLDDVWAVGFGSGG